VVADGRVSMTKGGQRVATLERGDGFGEIALLGNVPRIATCTAETAVRLYSLEKDPFPAAVTGHQHAMRAAELQVADRLAELDASP
jgi:CRP-like cAMP-binding protein